MKFEEKYSEYCVAYYYNGELSFVTNWTRNVQSAKANLTKTINLAKERLNLEMYKDEQNQQWLTAIIKTSRIIVRDVSVQIGESRNYLI